MSKSSYYYTVKVLEKDDEDIEIKEPSVLFIMKIREDMDTEGLL